LFTAPPQVAQGLSEQLVGRHNRVALRESTAPHQQRRDCRAARRARLRGQSRTRGGSSAKACGLQRIVAPRQSPNSVSRSRSEPTDYEDERRWRPRSPRDS